MGVCYKILMIDEWDFSPNPGHKEERLQAFEKAWTEHKWAPTREGTGYGWVVYDIDKAFPMYEPNAAIIKNYCDAAYYWSDIEMWEVRRL